MATKILIEATTSDGSRIEFTINEEGTTEIAGRSMTVLINSGGGDYDTITTGTYPKRNTKIALVDLEGVRKNARITGVKKTPAPDYRSHTEFRVETRYDGDMVIYATVI